MFGSDGGAQYDSDGGKKSAKKELARGRVLRPLPLLVGGSGEKVQTCRYEIRRLAAEAAEMPGRDSAACQLDERDARSKLEQDWAQYNAAQKSHCAGFAALDRAPSYVELLTCLEMAKQAQELPPDSKADTVGRK